MMFKRKLALFLAIAILCTLLPQMSFFAYAESYSGTWGDRYGTTVDWSFDSETGVLSFEGNGNMPYSGYVLVHDSSASELIPFDWELRSTVKEVHLSAGIKGIPAGLFRYFGALTAFTVAEDNPYLCSRDGILFNKSQTELLRYPTGRTASTYAIPGSVTSIQSEAFEGCSKLTNMTISDSVTSIGEAAFYRCSALTSVTIPGSVTSIGDCAFEDCSALTSVTIPDSVTSIGQDTFSGCSALTSVTIGNGVTSIGRHAFYNCSALTAFTVASNNPSYSSKDGVLFNKTKTKLIQYPVAKQGTFYSVPDGVTSISDYAMVNNTLISVLIPDSVDTIGYRAVGYMLSGTYYSKVYDFTIWGFSDSAAYRYAKDNGLTFVAMDTLSGTCGAEGDGSNLSWSLDPDTGTLTIEGSGAMAYFGWGDAPWYKHRKRITAVILPEGLTSIGNYAFYDCSSLTSVTIPDSVTSIGECAFDDCSALTSVTIPDSVTSIGEYAFYRCSALTSVTIPDSVTSIGDRGFLSGFWWEG